MHCLFKTYTILAAQKKWVALPYNRNGDFLPDDQVPPVIKRGVHQCCRISGARPGDTLNMSLQTCPNMVKNYIIWDQSNLSSAPRSLTNWYAEFEWEADNFSDMAMAIANATLITHQSAHHDTIFSSQIIKNTFIESLTSAYTNNRQPRYHATKILSK